MSRFLNIAAYKFVPLEERKQLRRELRSACEAAELRGTILLSREGINMFIAGKEEPLRQFLDLLTNKPQFAGLEVKESWSDQQPFSRMLVRLKAEIISLGISGIEPRRRTSPKLSASQLKQWLDEGRDITLLDVRNDYEVSVGTFTGARAIGLDHFRNFPAAVSTLPAELHDKPIVMFCTGGIRCEKAGPYMELQGFKDVYQLDGGILKYFEDCGGAHYEGDCFVFDKRVALDPNLQQSGLALCFVCQAILTEADQASPDYVINRSCPHCLHERAQGRTPSIEERNLAIRVATKPLPGSIAYDNVRPIRIPERLAGVELMECVKDLFPHMGEAYWQEEFQGGRVRLGDRIVDGSAIAKSGQRYSHWFPLTVEPDVNADIRVIFEDAALVVVDKPAPLPMHPSGRFNRNTLIWILRDALQMPCLRPVHRLDANTTGVAIFAKTKAVAVEMQRQFDAKRVSKIYLAQCHGVPIEERFTCDLPITRVASVAGSREIDDSEPDETTLECETHFVRLRQADNDTAIVQAHPITGRTNQIRLHLWHLGHPIVGDPMYLPGRKLGEIQTLDLLAAALEPMRLHAWQVEFKHPQTRVPMRLTAPNPSWLPQPTTN